MRLFAVAITGLMAGLLMAADQSPGDAGKKLKELHKERIATLKLIADLHTAQIASGFVTHEDIMQAKLRLLRAELDAAETDQERVAIHENVVELMKEFEEMTDNVVKHTHVDKTVYLKSKADRLKAEIDLERARSANVK